MSTEHSRSTSATGSTGRTTYSRGGHACHAGSSAGAGPSSDPSPDHVNNQREFILSMALAIAKKEKQMPLPGTMGTAVFGRVDVATFVEAYESLSSRTVTDTGAEGVIATFPYYCSETMPETMTMINQYLTKDWEQLKEELENAFRHADNRVYMYTRSYLERLCKDQRERGNSGLKAFDLVYDNISCIMLNKGALPEYSQVEMLLGTLPQNLSANAVTKLKLVPTDPSTFKYDKLRRHILDKCVTANALSVLDSQ